MILRVFCVLKRALFVTTTFIPVKKTRSINPKPRLITHTFCDGVANYLVLPPTPHKRASRPAPDL